MNNSGFKIRKPGVYHFFNHLACRGSECLSVTLNLSQGVVAPCFRARHHAIETFEKVQLDLDSLRRNVLERQAGPGKFCCDFFLGVFVACKPLSGKVG